MESTDVDEFARLGWSCLHLTPFLMKNVMFDLVLKDQATIEALMKSASITFAPGLLDAVKSTNPPDLAFFDSLPDDYVEMWAVYAIILEKPNRTPKLYIGSGTSWSGGVERRLYDYDILERLPVNVAKALDDRFTILQKGLLCWGPIPNPMASYRIRHTYLLLEAVFTVVFWALTARDNSYRYRKTADVCPWPFDALHFDGLCSHLPLTEGASNMFCDLSEDEAYEKLETHRAKTNLRDRLMHRKLRIQNMLANRFWCHDCNRAFVTVQGLVAHDVTEKHIDKVAGVVKVLVAPLAPSRAVHAIVNRRFYCPTCDTLSTTQGHLEEHYACATHLRNVAEAEAKGKEVEPVAKAPRKLLPKFNRRCDICKFTFTKPSGWESHIKTPRHIKKVKDNAPPKSTPSITNYFSKH